MAFSTELVLPGFQTINQTITPTSATQSTTVALPQGQWMCTFTGRVIVDQNFTRYLELDGVRVECGTVVDSGGVPPLAALGVCTPSIAGGRNITLMWGGWHSRSGTYQFRAARIG